MSLPQVMSKTLSVRFDDEQMDRLEEYRDQHAFKPDKSQVIRRALTEFLDRELAEDDGTG